MTQTTSKARYVGVTSDHDPKTSELSMQGPPGRGVEQTGHRTVSREDFGAYGGS